MELKTLPLLSSSQKLTLQKIFHFFSLQKYQEAENLVLSSLKAILQKNYKEKSEKEKDLIFLEALYTDFNFYYFQWLTKKKEKSPPKKNPEKKNGENFFLTHCLSPAKMENLLWETGLFLLSDEKKKINLKRKKIFSLWQKYHSLLSPTVDFGF